MSKLKEWEMTEGKKRILEMLTNEQLTPGQIAEKCPDAGINLSHEELAEVLSELIAESKIKVVKFATRYLPRTIIPTGPNGILDTFFGVS